MKKYDVAVKIISKTKFEVKANNEDEAIDKVEEVVFDSDFLLLNIDDRKVHFEAIESGNKELNECDNCEFCCPECGTCVYSEH